MSDFLFYTAGAFVLLMSLTVAVRVGFYVGKHVPYTRTFREEISRRAWIALTYVKVTIGIIIPPYGRRLRRKRQEAREAYMASLKPMERQPWWDARDE